MDGGGVLDPAALAELAETTGGDTEFLAELVDAYFSDSEELLGAMRSGLASGAAPEVRRAVHSLKSNSASFGARHLARLCQELEDRAKQGDLEDAADRVAAIEAEYRRAERALRAVRDGG
jgi:HPt (histidine-containing phosphotransfer) domain-containing protein